MPRIIALAVDDSECSLAACKWAMATVVRPDDEVHLLGAEALVTAGGAPAAPMAAAGSVAALAQSYQQALRDEERRVKALLTHVKETVLARPDLHAHALPAAGGASGVGESIAAWAKRHKPDLVIVGSRGMGAAKSALMSVVGLGSVSSYCLHHLDSAVVVVHGPPPPAEGRPRRVLVAVDDSDMARRAQAWAIDNVLGPQDELHLVAVALPVPYVAGVQAPVLGEARVPAGDFEAECRGSLEHAREVARAAADAAFNFSKIAADDAAAAHVLEAEEEAAAERGNRELAQAALDAAVAAAAAAKVPKERIFVKALEPEGGASDVGLSIKHYAEANGADVAVVGSRGMGAVKRALLSLVGLGSVSDWCANHMGCPVIVVRGGPAARRV